MRMDARERRDGPLCSGAGTSAGGRAPGSEQQIEEADDRQNEDHHDDQDGPKQGFQHRAGSGVSNAEAPRRLRLSGAAAEAAVAE